MIRPLRKLHGRAFIGIAIVVPVLIVTSLASRGPIAGENALPNAEVAADDAVEVVLESSGLWRSLDIVTRVLTPGDGEFQVELSAGEILQAPDLLLYWSDEDSGGQLPMNSHQLGAYTGGTRRFAMPTGLDPRDGMLVLYSLAYRSVLATAEVPRNGS